jgi:hypothetical protein
MRPAVPAVPLGGRVLPLLSPQASPVALPSLAAEASLAAPASPAEIPFAEPAMALRDKVEGGVIRKPTTLAELNRLDNSTQIFSLDQALRLGLSFGSADAKYNRRVYVKNFIQYQEITENDAKIWYGIGIRWVVNVKVIDANAKLTGIPAVAASAESKNVEATSQFQVYGLSNPKITKIAQTVPAELNLENYGAMYAAFEKITELIADKETIVSPLIVATILKEEDPEQDYAKSVVVSWAIANIASGKTLIQSQNDLSDYLSFADKEIIKSVYFYFTKNDDLNSMPDKISRERAKKLLKEIRIKKSWW